MRVFVTGSADGLGKLTAEALLDAGHELVVHVRSTDRRRAAAGLIDRGAELVVGDLAELDQVRDVVVQVNALGTMGAVIHNAGVYSGPHVAAVNVIAPFVLSAALHRPQRMVCLSSGMHRGGHPFSGGNPFASPASRVTYSDSKLYVTTLALALARLWPDVLSNAVDPGWVPTRMGGSSAPDDLRLGHLTQEWLATSTDPAALTSGGYWHHQRRRSPHPSAQDERFQARLLDALAAATGVEIHASS